MINFINKTRMCSGYYSVAYSLDDKYIQLVGKREDSYQTYKDIVVNTSLLKNQITCVEVPKDIILLEPSNNYPYGSLVYPMIKGKSLKAQSATPSQIEEIAKTLVEFNKQLHNINAHWDRTSTIKHEMENIYKNIELLKDFLTISEISALEKFATQFKNYLDSKKNFCITHGDLWEDNLLVDENNKLVGVIDFGNMLYFLPEVDYAITWNMCDGLLDKMMEYSDEDITKESVNLFIMYKEISLFECVLLVYPNEIENQIKNIRLSLNLLKEQKII